MPRGTLEEVCAGVAGADLPGRDAGQAGGCSEAVGRGEASEAVGTDLVAPCRPPESCVYKGGGVCLRVGQKPPGGCVEIAWRGPGERKLGQEL